MPAGTLSLAVIVQNINPFIHNVEKWLNILERSCVVIFKDFKSMFGHISTLCIKEFSEFKRINLPLSPLKLSENDKFFDYFR